MSSMTMGTCVSCEHYHKAIEEQPCTDCLHVKGSESENRWTRTLAARIANERPVNSDENK